MRHENLSVNHLVASEFGCRSIGAPNQVARNATGIVTFNGGAVTADDTITIGDVTYTVVADPTAVNSTDTAVYVDLGASVSLQATALAAAINATGASATTYASKADGTNIKPNPQAGAAIGFVSAAGDSVVVIARNPGVGGNKIAFTESADNTVNYQLDGSTVATTLTGGLSGNNLLDADNYTNITGYGGTISGMYEHVDAASPGAVAVVTVAKTNGFVFKNVKMYQYNATEQTILVPVPSADGLSIAGDQVENQIVEHHFGLVDGEKHVYRVGRDGSLKLRVKLKIDDVSGTDACLIGWRKAEAEQADFNGYDEMIAFNIVSGDISASLIKNNAATDTDDLGDDWADTESHELELRVGSGGTVTLLIDGVAPTTAHAGTLKFDANEIIVPFIHIIQDATLTPVYLQEFECGQIV